MIWSCISWDGVGYAAKIDGRMDSDLYCSILERDLSSISRKSARISSFNMTMIPNTRAKKPLLGLKITRFRSLTGQLNSQISTLLSIFGFTVGSKTVAMFGYFALHAMWSLIAWESLLALAE